MNKNNSIMNYCNIYKKEIYTLIVFIIFSHTSYTKIFNINKL